MIAFRAIPYNYGQELKGPVVVRGQQNRNTMMSALRAQVMTLATPAGPAGIADLDVEARQILNRLRILALGCRSAARTDLFEACALLSADPSVAETAHAEAFLKCLPQAIGRKVKLLRPGVEEVTFDEAWIMRLVGSASSKDDDSFGFLLRSRVAPQARRNLAYLVRSLSERFSRN